MEELKIVHASACIDLAQVISDPILSCPAGTLFAARTLAILLVHTTSDPDLVEFPGLVGRYAPIHLKGSGKKILLHY